MRRSYDASGRYGQTAAPVVDVALEWQGRKSSVQALIDTGASVTAVPRDEYQKLGLQKIGDPEDVSGVADAKADRTVVNLTFEGRLFRNLPILTTDGLPFVVIGRDVLNKYLLECDGPNLQFDLTAPAAP